MSTEGSVWAAVNGRKTDFGLHATDDVSGFAEDRKAWSFQLFSSNTLEKNLKYPGLSNLKINLQGKVGLSAPSSGLDRKYVFTQQ